MSQTPAITNVPVEMRNTVITYAGGELQGYYDGTSVILEQVSILGVVAALTDTAFANTTTMIISGSFVLN